MTLFFHLKASVERRFREAAMKKNGYTKGALKNALEEAIEEWLVHNNAQPPEENESPIKK